MPICLCPCPSITGLIPLPLTSCDHARGTMRWGRGEEPWNTRLRHDAVEEGRSRLTGFSLKLHLSSNIIQGVYYTTPPSPRAGRGSRSHMVGERYSCHGLVIPGTGVISRGLQEGCQQEGISGVSLTQETQQPLL